MDRSPASDRPPGSAVDLSTVVGCILAGGLATRMGGGDKGLAILAGRPMMARAVERLRARLGTVVLNANGDPARFAAFGLPVVADDPPEQAGPLAGVLAAMDWTARHRPGSRFVLTVAADTPFFPEELPDALAAAAAEGGGPIVAESEEGRHPVFGLWPTGLRGDLRRFLAEGASRRVMGFVDACGGGTVRFPPRRAGTRRFDPFFNVNTPDDLAAAEAIARDLDADRPMVDHGPAPNAEDLDAPR